MSIALKETNETLYWLDLLYKADFINENLFNSFESDAKEILKILISIVKNKDDIKTINQREENQH